MHFVHVTIELDPEGRIDSIRWYSEDLQRQFAESWDGFLGQPASSLFPHLPASGQTAVVTWKENSFLCGRMLCAEKEVLLLRQGTDREYLLERALDQLPEGVQIYDQNAYAVYFNARSRQISDIPEDLDVEGMHLLDMYRLDENISTTLTALRTGQPVINRVDSFSTHDGTRLATANTAFPIRRDGDVLGAAVFEQTREVVSDYLKRMNDIHRALDAYEEDTPTLHFAGYTFRNILGEGPALQEAVSIARKVAGQDSDVLIVGETGTGKELFAQAIHNASSRHKARFLPINCAAIPESLMEGLLFGTARGSFTGSVDRTGYLEEASGGTLFLDELNSMSLTMQSKLLRAVQERTIRRVGGTRDIRIDVRFISSCNEDPFTAIRENRLRRDIFYRLSTVMINLPSLREHPQDTEALLRARIRNNNPHFVNKVEHVTPEVLQFFQSYDWPGNVRELFHVVDYAMNITDSDTIGMDHLPKYLLEGEAVSAALGLGAGQGFGPGAAPAPAEPDWHRETLQTVMDRYEEEILRRALDRYGGNISQTAAALGIKRQSLQYRIRKYGIIL